MGLPADTPIKVSKARTLDQRGQDSCRVTRADTRQKSGWGRSAQVRKGGGKAGTRASLPDAVRRTLLQRWDEVLAGPTGCADYAAFRRSLRDSAP